MDKCMECNSTLKSTETECWACGSIVQPKVTSTSMGKRFSSVINVIFIGSVVMTVASLVFDATPPFSKCVCATVVLFLAKSSAVQMLEKKEKG